MSERKHRPVVAEALILLLLAGLILALWLWTPLGEWADAERLATAAADMRHSTWALPLVVAAFVVGSLVFVPLTALVTATALTFEPLTAILYTYLGSLAGGTAGYGAGVLLGRPAMTRLAGSRIARLGERLRRHGLLAVTALRLVPVAHFTLTNMAAGAWRIRLWEFLLGSVIGLAPGILGLNLLGAQLRRVLEQPSRGNLALLTGVVLVVALALWWLRRRVRRG